MSELAAIASALQARITRTARGAILTFRRGDDWYHLTGRESPHLELTMDAAELGPLSLHVHLGRETLLGSDAEDAARAHDPRWKVRGPLHLFDEPPWPAGDRGPPAPGAPGPEKIAAAMAVGFLTYGLLDISGVRGTSPTPHYVLTVADGKATIERRTSELDSALAVGAAHRLIQLVTRPTRVHNPPPAHRGWRPSGPPYR